MLVEYRSLNLKKTLDSIRQKTDSTTENMGFSPLICKIVQSHISSVSYIMVVKGSPSLTPPFNNQRGIRQEDSLSYLWFDFVMGNLCKFIVKKVQEINLTNTRSMWQLQYSTCFSLRGFKANKKSLSAIGKILEVFIK